MKLKIGVMGSATGVMSRNRRKNSLTNWGARSPIRAASRSRAPARGFPWSPQRVPPETGGLVVGISPALSEWEHVNKYHSPLECHDVIIYTGSGLMGREVVNIRSSDIVIIIGGHSGTLGEFSIAYDEGKLIGVLVGSGGITTEIKHLVKKIKKKTGARILYVENPRSLVKRLVQYFRKIHYRHPSIHHNPEMSMP